MKAEGADVRFIGIGINIKTWEWEVWAKRGYSLALGEFLLNKYFSTLYFNKIIIGLKKLSANRKTFKQE